MPMSARAGIVLLLVGAITIGIGTYVDKGAISLYGLIMVSGGFIIYIVSSITSYNRKRGGK